MRLRNIYMYILILKVLRKITIFKLIIDLRYFGFGFNSFNVTFWF